MNNFYPNGAIKGRDQFESRVIAQLKKPGALYLVSFPRAQAEANFYKLNLGDDAELHFIHNMGWHIENSNPPCSLNFVVNPDTDYIESIHSGGFVFNNFWHAYAYIKQLEQSKIEVAWNFRV
jgi:hypothetical protein